MKARHVPILKQTVAITFNAMTIVPPISIEFELITFLKLLGHFYIF